MVRANWDLAQYLLNDFALTHTWLWICVHLEWAFLPVFPLWWRLLYSILASNVNGGKDLISFRKAGQLSRYPALPAVGYMRFGARCGWVRWMRIRDRWQAGVRQEGCSLVCTTGYLQYCVYMVLSLNYRPFPWIEVFFLGVPIVHIKVSLSLVGSEWCQSKLVNIFSDFVWLF